MLLRTWVELGAYLTDVRRRFSKSAFALFRSVSYDCAVGNRLMEGYLEPKVWFSLESAREQYEDAIGAHHSQSMTHDQSTQATLTLFPDA